MTKQQIKEHLLKVGVQNLKEFGYPDVDTKNIMTDIIYSQFFKSMLLDNKGISKAEVDDVIDDLLKDIPTI